MNTIKFKEMVGQMNTATIIELRKIETYNMFNTDHSMWMDISNFDFYFDEFRTDWVQQ